MCRSSGSEVQWFRGPEVQWLRGPVVQSSSSSEVQWFRGPVVQRSSGSEVQWFRGPVVQWFRGPVVQRSSGSERSSGPVVQWFRGPVVQRSSGSEVQWSRGPEVQWFRGPEVQRSRGPEVQWFRGPVVQWFSGPEVQWFRGPVVQRSSGPEVQRSRGPVVQRSSGSEVQRSSGSEVQWFRGPEVQWFRGSEVQWFSGPEVQWFRGPVVQRFRGPVVQRSSGPVVQWSSGPVVQRSRGPVVQRSSGSEVQWFRGSEVQWFRGPVVQRSSGPVVQRSSGSEVQWSRGPVVQRSSGSEVQWSSGPEVQWFRGSEVQWSRGPVVQRSSGPEVQWFRGPVVQRSSGPEVQWFRGPVVQRSSGSEVQRSSGPEVQWFRGPVVQRSSGPEVQWFRGPVVQRSSGSEVQWSSGSEVQWFRGPEVQWFRGPVVQRSRGPVVQRSSGSEVQWFRGPEVQRSSGSEVQWFRGPVVQWFRGPEVQWFRDPVVQRSSGPEVQRSSGPEVQWSRGPEVQWFRGPVVQRSRGPEVQWFRGPVVQRSSGPVVQRSRGPVVQRSSGSEVQWSRGPEVQRSSGPEVQWSSGPEVQWSRGPVVQRSSGPEVQWFRGPEVQRSSGSEVQWFRGPEVQRSSGSEVQWFRGPVVQRSRGPEVQRSRGPVVQRSSGPEVQRSSGPVVQRSSGPVVQRSSGSEVQWFRGPEVQRSRGPEVQRFRGPVVQRSSGPEVQRSRGPVVQRSSGSEVQRSSGSEVQRFKGPEVQRSRGPVVQRSSGSEVQRSSGSEVQWFRGPVVQWFSGSEVQWFRGPVVQRSSGPEVQRSSGSEVQRFKGSEVQRSSGSEVQWSSGSVVQRSSGSEVQWFRGPVVQRSSGPEVQRSRGPVVQRSSGSEVQRSSGSEVQWFRGPEVQWFRGSEVQWSSGSEVQWFRGPVVQWFRGPVVQRSRGPVVQRFRGPVVQWFRGPVVQRSSGPEVQWSSGPVVQRSRGPVVQRSSGSERSSGPVVQWFRGPVVQRSSGPEVQWFRGPVVQRSSGSEVQWFRDVATLSVTTIKEEPYAMSRGSELEGFCVDLLSELSKRVGFSYKIQEVKDGRYGFMDQSGTWTGMIGEIIRGEADLAVAPLTLTSVRERHVDMSAPFLQTGLGFLLRKELVSHESSLSLLGPFSADMWGGLLGAFLLTGLCIFLVSRMSPTEWAEPETEQRTFTLLHSFWYTVTGRSHSAGAENSALVLANESQREAYERCLDEVANHVVQALLNQKDLREECIKLKVLVCDLERQNRALCELFQQKLPNHPTAHYQVQAGPHLPEFTAPLPHESKQEAAHTEAQAKGNGVRSQHASPARAAHTSMEALSPFFKKKAHILEVLRKMEETDPLKFHPTSSSLGFCDYSQVLMSTEAVLASADPHSLQYKPLHSHCRCTCPEAERLNGDGSSQSDPHSKRSPESPHSKRSPESPHSKRSPESPTKACSQSVCSSVTAQSLGAAAAGECEVKSLCKQTDTQRSEAQAQRTKPHSQQSGPREPPAIEDSEEYLENAQEPDPEVTVLEELPGFTPDDSTSSLIPERDTCDPSTARASASVSPSPSCLSDVKSVAINSPSKLLKFLKIPSITEKCQASSNAPAVRLSPQLTRNSRIPCRTNNYEVYHSPVPTRRATTTERCRQPPPPPTRSESYPATHSAPTSPPQSEDTLPEKDYASPAKSKMVATSSNTAAASKVSIPHYENVCDVMAKVSDDPGGFEKRTIPQVRANIGERKLVKSLPESVLKASNDRKQSSSSTTDSTSDEEDSESPVWVNHQNVPTCQPAGKAHFTRPVDKQEAKDGIQPPPPSKRVDSSSIPKRPSVVTPKSQGDPSHHAFKERLAALGKLRSSDDLQVGFKQVDTAIFGEVIEEQNVRTVDRPQPTEIQKEEVKFAKYAESLECKSKVNDRGIKYSAQMFEQVAKSQQPPAKPEIAKPDAPKSKIGLPSPITDAPQVLRNNIKCPGSLNLPYNVKTANSPNKIPPKSPSKPCPTSVQRMSKASEAPRYSSKSEERTKIGGKGKKNPIFGDSLPPPPPKPPVETQVEKPAPPATSPQSAIEQKVMKGIEENMLKEQDKVVLPGEVKQKTSNGIASWFGLKKSKLPALSRKTDGVKAKDEKREWKINIPSVGRDSVKVSSRCKEGVEGLNISTLMEKAEGLRRALEEERQFVERQTRGHSCEVVMDQSQGQLAVMYRGGRSDTFMQQLLNRVDGKDVVCLPQRRLSFDCKNSKPVFHTDLLSRDHMDQAADRNITSDENLADSVQHFAAGSGASTYTLDSGIGTFPLPECSSGSTGRGLSRSRDHSSSPGRAGRRSRTLEREVPSQDDCYSHKPLQPGPYGLLGEGRPSAIREDGPSVFSPRTKTWTFPNLKAPTGPAEVYLAVEEEEEEAYSSSYRAVRPSQRDHMSLKSSGPSSSRVVDPGSLPVPVQAAVSRRGKTRAPSVPEMNPAALDPLSPSRPPHLETPESLSDSLYDSLSSCGSQG
uniref:Uncharacterized protein n=1 Tax=Knipowitschia caucasica TaxID=637954 RepID=A0AAV2M2A9_KNICA